MLKKILAWALVVSLTAAAAIGGTLAYLTDRDSEANVFTVGDVKIDLNESFDQGATLIPGVNIEKKPTITNVGPNTAWVWATVAVPAALDKVIDFVIDFSGEGAGWGHWTKGPRTTQIDGKDYVLYNILHTEPLAVNGETNALFSNVALDKTVDIDPNGNWYTVVDGAATDLGWNNANGNPVIHVSAYAIQTEGFADVNAAYAAYQAQWADNGAEYAPVVIDTPVELEDALNSGTPALLAADIVVDEPLSVSQEAYIDLNGHTLTTSGLDFQAGGTISRGKIVSDTDTEYLAHVKSTGDTLTIEDVDIYISHHLSSGIDRGATFAEYSGIDVTGGSLVLNHCTVTVCNNTTHDVPYLYGITVQNGSVTMNGGSMVFGGVPGRIVKYNAVVSSFGTYDVVNLNGVNIQNANCIMAYGQELTINTNVSLDGLPIGRGNGSTCTINYNP